MLSILFYFIVFHSFCAQFFLHYFVFVHSKISYFTFYFILFTLITYYILLHIIYICSRIKLLQSLLIVTIMSETEQFQSVQCIREYNHWRTSH